MKKADLYILLLLLFCSSCSKKMYYVYEDEKSYCTIEAIPKRKMWWLFGHRFDQVIYRATSKEHYDTTEEVEELIHWREMQNTKKDNIYIYIKNTDYNVKEKINIKVVFEMYMIQRNNVYRYDFLQYWTWVNLGCILRFVFLR